MLTGSLAFVGITLYAEVQFLRSNDAWSSVSVRLCCILPCLSYMSCSGGGVHCRESFPCVTEQTITNDLHSDGKSFGKPTRCSVSSSSPLQESPQRIRSN